VPAGGLLQAGCGWWHAVLQGAWRGKRCQHEGAPSPLKATRAFAWGMGAAVGVRRRAASSTSPLEATRGIASRMAGAGAASTRDAPSPLKATRNAARIAHGGGKRCQREGCIKSAVAGGTPHCVAHGGGKRGHEQGCPKAARGDTQQHCVAHGGGRRCLHEGCTKSAQGARNTSDELTVLYSNGPDDKVNATHATLPGAWRRQAVPAGGLLQASRSRSRQCVLHAMSPARRCAGRCIATA
jgi:hypothetical protein